MKFKTLGLVGIGLSLFGTGVHAEESKIKQGESVIFNAYATPTFYAASSDSTICQVVFDISSNGISAVVEVTGVTPGGCKVFYFNNNVLNGTKEYNVVGSNDTGYSIVPCYEFYSPIANDHFYTADEELKRAMMGVYASWGYKFQGIAYYVYKKDVY
jgi:hypothetical protein